MNIVDALRRYNYNVSKGKVDGETLSTIDTPCDPCGTQTCRLDLMWFRHACRDISVHETWGR